MNPQDWVKAFGKRPATLILLLIGAFAFLNALSDVAANVWIENKKLATQKSLEAEKARLTKEVEAAKVEASRMIEQDKKGVEVTKLFFDGYQGKPAAEQTQTLDILVTLYPDHFIDVQKLLFKQAANAQVKTRVKTAEVTAVNLSRSGGQTKADVAAAAERSGFQAIIRRDLRKARSDFEKAYKAFPTYHSVDEIYHRVLSEDLLGRYSAASPQRKEILLAQLTKEILLKYGWGIPDDLRPGLQKLTV